MRPVIIAPCVWHCVIKWSAQAARSHLLGLATYERYAALSVSHRPAAKICVTVSGRSCRKEHDGTSYSRMCCDSRSPGRLRRWAPGIAKRPGVTQSNWCTTVLLGCGTDNFICAGATGCVAARNFNDGGDDLPGVDHAYRDEAEAGFEFTRLGREGANVIAERVRAAPPSPECSSDHSSRISI